MGRLSVVRDGKSEKGAGGATESKLSDKPLLEVPGCPDHLDGFARREWKRIAPLMVDAGLLTELDLNTLAAYCLAYADLREAAKMQAALKRKDRANAGLIIVGEKGTPYMSPQLQIKIAAAREMTKLAAQLGLNPTARAAIDRAGKGGAGRASASGAAKKYSF